MSPQNIVNTVLNHLHLQICGRRENSSISYKILSKNNI